MPVLSINTAGHFVAVAILDQGQVRLELDSRVDFRPSDNQSIGIAAGDLDQLPPGFSTKRNKGSRSTGSRPAQRLFPPGASIMLAPLIKEILERAGCSVSELDLIAVATGPGPFTGLRVGVVTAKTLAYAGKVDILAVNALEATAFQATTALSQEGSQGGEIHVIANAQRQQLFCGRYAFGEKLTEGRCDVHAVHENLILDRKAWLDQLPERCLVTGPGLKPLEDAVGEQRPGVTIAPESIRDLTAGSVGQLAWQRWTAGQRDNLWDVHPVYFRPSAAEEVRAARQS